MKAVSSRGDFFLGLLRKSGSNSSPGSSMGSLEERGGVAGAVFGFGCCGIADSGMAGEVSWFRADGKDVLRSCGGAV